MQIDFNKFYKDKTILISGGGGYIGSSLTKALSQVDCTLKVVSSSSPSWLPNNCTANFSFIPGDISNLDFWLQLAQRRRSEGHLICTFQLFLKSCICFVLWQILSRLLRSLFRVS